MMSAHQLDNRELLQFLTYIELQNNHRYPLRFPPRPSAQPRQIDHAAIERFEQRQGESFAFELPACDPTPFEVDILRLLPQNLTILQLATKTKSKYEHVRKALAQLERIGLSARRTSNQHWPTPEGFALIGLKPIAAPKRNNQYSEA